ncbi:phage tail protein [Azospirillum soli]|uniref:phage tail protein n=1 Tax=Azospirillum soli TaxID=1304799 RepID=UPI001AE3531F|nr:tail fiber protein [Azospirillum soli]MBP2312715.1 microcystin-dependent protein [Azospirillum soli]
MAEAYIGEIRLFPYNNIPSGWHVCDGSLLTVQQNVALFSLLSTSFGGDGRTNFALPDLRGRTIIGAYGVNQNVATQVGGKGGTETVTLTQTQMPVHNHTLQGSSSNAGTANPTNGYFAVPTAPSTLTNPPATPPIYSPATTPQVALNSNIIQPAGGNQPHENRQPFIALQYCICVSGYYPQRS